MGRGPGAVPLPVRGCLSARTDCGSRNPALTNRGLSTLLIVPCRACRRQHLYIERDVLIGTAQDAPEWLTALGQPGIADVLIPEFP